MMHFSVGDMHFSLDDMHFSLDEHPSDEPETKHKYETKHTRKP